ncbi:MAG: AmmeMemoRadiSam system radical SAM enzyme [Nanoarchaeota archaeon]|nr:AmmeMemoRadiSam system radical SAM enzyme [Nanoarchaeota archaeon]MBU1269880.1 AmmeMemoRadiSam system radical SAM enzyme [Nanoarchaeota archaeon]MBU1604630.1 AmmeMemoRadiSam system radical SAM enzyme [Nanoarchaeota archaeon]MBU2443055.1 AmmeMemoRadiSam system radical SAM enzyme [Nanoarchaeota archaeon]
MKEASYYKSKNDNKVQCLLCPKKCTIKPENVGFCRVRKNINGKLYSLVYGRVAGGLAVDPIEKKPLFHFLPGSGVLSFGTVGCNLSCKHCQNFNTSQIQPGQGFEKDFLPIDIVKVAKEKGCETIAFTYNEPTIFFEFMLETAKIAKKEGLKCVIVSNGFINPKPLRELCKYINGANIDLKSFNDLFYRHVTSAWIKPVLESIKILKKEGVWVEITNLLIPTLNDDLGEIKKMCVWIKDNLGADVPLHFSAFHPDFELRNIPPTTPATLLNAYDVAKSVGLHHVYIGNVMMRDYENTKCPKCKLLLIERIGYNILQNNIFKGRCKFCNEKMSGVFK